LKLKEALQEYEKRKEAIMKQREGISKKYTESSKEIVSKILRTLENLEQKELPKKIDPQLARIVGVERERYTTALRNMVRKIESIEDVKKILPEISKFHVAHGRHLLLVFEREIYEINALLKSLSKEYSAYLEEINKVGIENVKAKELLKELEDLKSHTKEEERSKENLMTQLKRLQEQIEELENKPEFKALKESEEKLRREISQKEIKIRSKVSKLQKPIKRMRMPDATAKEFLENSAYAIHHPEEFLKLLDKIKDNLDKKYRKTAEWAKTNLVKESQELAVMKERLTKIEEKLSTFIGEEEAKKREIEELKKKIQEKEEKIRSFKKQIHELEEELRKSISKLERILGEKIERS
jgi:chromosome segregation ATPase